MDGVPPSAITTIARIDDAHANAHTRWVEIGKPAYPKPSQVDDLHDASRVVAEPYACQHHDDALWLDVSLPPNAVAAVTIRVPATGTGVDSSSA